MMKDREIRTANKKLLIGYLTNENGKALFVVKSRGKIDAMAVDSLIEQLNDGETNMLNCKEDIPP